MTKAKIFIMPSEQFEANLNAFLEENKFSASNISKVILGDGFMVVFYVV